VEYGDLIMAESAGQFAWKGARELGLVVAGKGTPKGKTLFKSGGVAIEDVAVASHIYDKAMAAGIDAGEFSFD
jgi:ornithine cyclodeaminase/alanine dehydrogenase-like protein (mu-crystallin family)